MDWIFHLIDFILHLDHHMIQIVKEYGAWTYLIVFLIVFCETGLIVMPFLPGDSLLFMIGALAAVGSLELPWVILLLTVAAILGDTVNYWIGNLLAPKVFANEKIRFVNPAYLEKTQRFFDKYGGKTIIIARFVPIVRTVAPFLAGVGAMSYGKFLAYNVIGGIAWVLICTLAGYFFGNLEIVRENFSLVVLAIIIISLVPGIVEIIKHRREQKLRHTPPSKI